MAEVSVIEEIPIHGTDGQRMMTLTKDQLKSLVLKGNSYIIKHWRITSDKGRNLDIKEGKVL